MQNPNLPEIDSALQRLSRCQVIPGERVNYEHRIASVGMTFFCFVGFKRDRKKEYNKGGVKKKGE